MRSVVNRMGPEMDELESKYQRLRELLRNFGTVLVAFSGGVDSSLLLKVAVEVLGGRVLAVTVRSETTARREVDDASRLAGELGARHRVMESRELEIPEVAANPRERCYYCKKNRYEKLIELAAGEGIGVVADGENVDDAGDFRPGTRAARELGVRSPLREAGLGKEEIRALSRRLGLFTWNKPAFACLASRIPYGSPLTEEKLRRVEAAETYLYEIGVRGSVRVRCFGETARIETAPGDIEKVASPEIRDRIVERFQELGFRFVTLDLAGYRTGNLNR